MTVFQTILFSQKSFIPNKALEESPANIGKRFACSKKGHKYLSCEMNLPFV